ncbi:MAG TPA: PilZ domain-containing protein [Terriglobales bacterium]|nr:PilZ domain-containing protein [Terriglobales bacterium]
MGAKLLDAITSRLCSHQFAWPRRRPDGRYYQVCVLCGAEYMYDWNSMTRTGRIEPAAAGQAPAPAGHRSRRRSNWVPRARRLRVTLPLQYRQMGTEKWHSGTVENISQSGVLFRASDVLAHDTDVELIFEMPEEITGQQNSRVLCQGYIVRAVRGATFKHSHQDPAIAAAISGYSFFPEADAAADQAGEEPSPKAE